MNTQTNEVVVIMTKGAYDEVSSVALTIANGALTAGLTASLFLTSSAIDLVRKNGVEHTHVSPMEPLKNLLHDFIERGGKVWSCPPCTYSRGYVQDCLIDGVEIIGASAMFARVKEGAVTLSF